MSITDELRKYVQSWRETPNLMDDLDAGDIDGLLGDFEHIADRIDAEHERVCKEQYACGVEHGIGASIEASMIQEHGFIELPKDADGVPIRLGDVMEHRRRCVKSPATVDHMELWEDGGHYFWTIKLNTGDESHGFSGCELRHHHEPTVEDVLREFAYGLGVPVADSYVAAAATKLRLAKEVE